MAVIASDLLNLLACPETHKPLTLASEPELVALKRSIQEGKARRRDGARVAPSVEAALLTQDRRRAYLIEAGIPNLLIDERLELDQPL